MRKSIDNIYYVLNVTLFGINLLIQFISLSYIYSADYTILFKEDKVVLSGVFIVLVIAVNIFLVTTLSEVYNNVNVPKTVYSNIMALLPTVIALSSIIISVWFMQALLSITNGFKDSISLPFNIVVKYNWSLSERIRYLRDILEKQAVPEPEDLELRVRDLTTSMDSIRELAADMERSHIEELRARILAKSHPLTDTGSLGLFNDVSNWIHTHQWEILVGSVAILGTCAFALYIGSAISKIEADLATAKGDIVILDQNMTGLAMKQSAESSASSTIDIANSQTLTNLDQALLPLDGTSLPRILEDHFDRIFRLRSEFTALEKLVDHKFNTLEGIRYALVRSGEVSFGPTLPPSIPSATITDLFRVTLNNREAMACFERKIAANEALINSLSVKVDSIPVEQIAVIASAVSESSL